MNKIEHLLVCLTEELAETNQEVSKCLRFSANHLYEPYGTTNLQRLQLEFADVCAIAYLLRELGVETCIFPPADAKDEFIERYFDKMRRTEDSYKVAIELGALQV